MLQSSLPCKHNTIASKASKYSNQSSHLACHHPASLLHLVRLLQQLFSQSSHQDESFSSLLQLHDCCCSQHLRHSVAFVSHQAAFSLLVVQSQLLDPNNASAFVCWISTKNKNQCNLSKGGMTHMNSPGGSIGLTFWLAPFPEGQGPPSNRMCHWTPQVYLPNGI